MSHTVNGSQSVGKGNSAQTEAKTVNAPDKTHISSFVGLANAQVEAAINYLLYDYEGSQIPAKALHELASQIKGIVSLTFAGEAEISPDTSLPVYVQVPDYIAIRLGDQEQVDILLDGAKVMRDAALNDPQFSTDTAFDFEETCDALQWMIKTAQAAFLGREQGREINPPMAISGPMMPFIPQFIFDHLSDEVQTKTLRDLIAKMGTAAELDDYNNAGGENTPAYKELIRALHQWVDLAQKSMVLGSPEPSPDHSKIEKAVTPKPTHKSTLYRVVRKGAGPTVTIESDCIFFDLITDMDFLGEFIENVSAWFGAWTTDIEMFPGDNRTSHFHFANLMEFLGRMPAAVEKVIEAEHEAEIAAKTINGLEKEVQLMQELNSTKSDHGNALLEHNDMLKKSIAVFERQEAEIKRLRDLYEPSVTDSTPTADTHQQ